jgi:Zn-dependent protease
MRIFKAFDIPVYLHWSFWLLVAFIILPFGSPAEFAFGLYLAVMIPAMVVAHEFGHSIVAQRYGHKVSKIVLFGLGGQAHIQSLGRPKPNEELAITIAGPGVNLVLALFGISIYALLFSVGIVDTSNLFLLVFILMNLMMGIFNLVPAFPMDGGRLLRAGLSKYLGHVKATRIATGVSFVLASAMGIAAIYFMQPILFLIAGFIAYTSMAERKGLVR